MIRRLNLQEMDEARELLALQKLSYRQEADLVGSEQLPPLHESLEALQQSTETFYGYILSGQLVGAISYKREGGLLDIYRMMIHPDYFRRGIARTLLQFVEGCEPGIKRIIVSTGSLNAPACALYERQGFTATAEEEIVPDLWITHFEKTL
jgi:ribosomal protein S18 acetylase RimI-like enzyme